MREKLSISRHYCVENNCLILPTEKNHSHDQRFCATTTIPQRVSDEYSPRDRTADVLARLDDPMIDSL